MKIWPELLAASLIGTGRAQLPSLAGGTPTLDAFLHGLEGRSAECRLLSAAAAVSTWRRAGALAQTLPLALPSAASPGDRSECSPAAASHLARMLQDPALAPVLPEWLAALTRADFSLPHRWLPELLDAACQSDGLRPLILPALGQRGAWLAAQNADWAHLLVPTDRAAISERWSTAPFAGRLHLLRQVRRTDPAFGRELVTSTWEQEPPRERAAFLLGLGLNLSMEDEPFAETALDNRRKEVRAGAVDLAASLPGSRLCRRMSERVRPLLQFQPGEKPSLRNLGMGKQASLQVALPETCDKGMLRDGVEPKPDQRARLGERAWWLAQMLGAVPLQTWTDAWNTTPGELVAAAAEGEWREPLWIGWQVAALRYRDAGWAYALVEAALELTGRQRGTETAAARADVQAAHAMIEQLWPVLPTERQEGLIAQAFRPENQALHDQHIAGWLLTLTRDVWSETLGRITLRSLQARIRMNDSTPNRDWQLRSFFKLYARCVPPSLAAEAANGWERGAHSWSYWGSAVDEFLTVLQFRHDMLAALSAS